MKLRELIKYIVQEIKIIPPKSLLCNIASRLYIGRSLIQSQICTTQELIRLFVSVFQLGILFFILNILRFVIIPLAGDRGI